LKPFRDARYRKKNFRADQRTSSAKEGDPVKVIKVCFQKNSRVLAPQTH
jgi:hypothetical protein